MKKDTRLSCIKQTIDNIIDMIKQDSAWLKPDSQNYFSDKLENLKTEIEVHYEQK